MKTILLQALRTFFRLTPGYATVSEEIFTDYGIKFLSERFIC